MHLTKQTDHALRVLIYLALARPQLVTIAEIATSFRISRNNLMKIVNQLGKREYIETMRGKGGGIHLSMEPDLIRIGEVVKLFEGTRSLIDCAQPPCPIIGSCLLTGALSKARDDFFTSLNQYTLQDVVMNSNHLRVALPSLSC